jgi:hypothetical protein
LYLRIAFAPGAAGVHFNGEQLQAVNPFNYVPIDADCCWAPSGQLVSEQRRYKVVSLPVRVILKTVPSPEGTSHQNYSIPRGFDFVVAN